MTHVVRAGYGYANYIREWFSIAPDGPSNMPVSRQEVTLPLKGKDSRIGYTTILISDAQKKLLGSGIIFQQLS